MMEVTVNGETQTITTDPSSYLCIDRTWSTGDSVEIILPMHNTVEQLSNVPSYKAFLHGPILLGAKTGTEDLAGLIANDDRWAHIASGSLLPVHEAPIIVEDNLSSIADKLVPVEGKPLTFIAPELNIVNSQDTLEFEPFFNIHDARYMMYWMALTEDQYEQVHDSIAAAEAERIALENRTLDFVQPGQQQPESDHFMQTSNSNSGTHMNEFWRDASNGGYFSYQLSTNEETNLSLMVRYWGNESGYRTFDILIDGEKLVTESLTGKWNVSEFRNVEYPIPNSMIEGKSNIRVKFQAPASGTAGGVFYIRLLRQEPANSLKKNSNKPDGVIIQGSKNKIRILGLKNNSRLNIFDLSGRLIESGNLYSQDINIAINSGMYLVSIVSDTDEFLIQKVFVN